MKLPQPPMDKEFDKLVERVAEVAEEAFWREVADQFPEIKTGDLNPYSATLFSLECERVIKEWIETNRVTNKTSFWKNPSPRYAQNT
jgi:hypothetical protein